MSLKVIGAGFGRTGTMTLKLALEMLGFQRCYHMIEVIHSPPRVAETWLDAVAGKTPNWDGLFRGFTAAVDWPVIHFLPELVQRYPTAMIVLTERDADSWYNSARKTIFKAIRNIENGWMPKHQKLSYELIIEKTFNGNIDDRGHAISVYKKHVEWVKTCVPRERLICFSVSDGWKGLCHPLNLPIPHAPFPHKNSSSEFRRNFITRQENSA